MIISLIDLLMKKFTINIHSYKTRDLHRSHIKYRNQKSYQKHIFIKHLKHGLFRSQNGLNRSDM